MAKLKPAPNAKMHPKLASANAVFRNNKYSGENLSFEDFYKLSQQPCYYCNSGPSQTKNVFTVPSYKSTNEYNIINGEFIYNGLDRLDSSKPHSLENCVPCCKFCNFAKHNMSVKDFKKWITKVYKYFVEKSK